MSKNFSVAALLLLGIISCGQPEKPEFPLDKRYWTNDDYRTVIHRIEYLKRVDKPIPLFSSSETSAVVKKLTDEENFRVVLDDPELGVSYKEVQANEFFDTFRLMNRLYRDMDRTDKYLHEEEMLRISQFGLGLQILYFKLGNEKILAEADDPNGARSQNLISGNVQTLIRNYQNYLDEVNNEGAFTDNGLKILSEGIDKYLQILVQTHPEANFSGLRKKASLMQDKSSSESVRAALKQLIRTIDEAKAEKAPDDAARL